MGIDYYELGRDGYISGVEICPIRKEEHVSKKKKELTEANIRRWWDGWLDCRTEEALGISREEWSKVYDETNTYHKSKELLTDRFNGHKKDSF